MNEKDILQKLKSEADRITPPASLEPEAIEKLLNDRKPSESISAKTSGKIRRYRRFAAFGSIAAVFALAFTVQWQSGHSLKNSATSGSPNELLALAETEVEDTEPKAESIQQVAEEAVPEADSIQQAAEEAAPETENVLQAADTVPEDTLSYASGYEEIYKALYDRFYQMDHIDSYDSGAAPDALYEYEAVEDSVEMSSAADSAPKTSAARNNTALSDTTGDSGNYSGTNLQELGVDEGDIAKTDGRYIYILRKDLTFAIIRADEGHLEQVSITGLNTAKESCIQEMYLDGDVLNIIITEYVTTLETDSASELGTDIYYSDSKRQTTVLTYDISDRNAPVLTGSISQDGSYEDSRKNGRYLYLFTAYYPDIRDTYDNSVIVPRINGTEASADDFYLPESLQDSTYLIISSMDTGKPEEILDSKILVSGASRFYVSTENIYIANEKYNSASTVTELVKFHYENGHITGVAAGSVRGYLNNSFSMNEYDGMLRVVTTYYGDDFNAVRDFVSEFTGEYYEDNWTEHNALYILDESLQKISAIEDLAEGETIRSARFFGNTGYFVTFRQTDPLFSVDLSDPTAPKLLGELKISGFSSYLHFFGENLLLGIGYEADEDTGITSGLKLSMFDISDPTAVKEIHRLVLPGITWCPTVENYKSILVSPERGLIGFFCDNRYLLFSYDEKDGFTATLTYNFYSDMLMGSENYDTVRGLYIDHTFYVTGNAFVLSFDMEKQFLKKELLRVD